MAGEFLNVGYVVLEKINYLIFSSYLCPFRDEILTAIIILFSAWLLIINTELEQLVSSYIDITCMVDTRSTYTGL